ncbi:hypothetical protein GCM10019016_040510 [Streptomyces prasinosporus]|uniref:Uncharacterized protein n=1 Tax=Streptomyces prasinosporus TaxID=68256 RepID=A0ABP6TQ44_9ACTN
MIRFFDFSRAPTWSQVATTFSMKDSVSTAEARKESPSPSSIGVPSLSTYGPVIFVDLPALVLYALFAPEQHASYDANR